MYGEPRGKQRKRGEDSAGPARALARAVRSARRAVVIEARLRCISRASRIGGRHHARTALGLALPIATVAVHDGTSDPAPGIAGIIANNDGRIGAAGLVAVGRQHRTTGGIGASPGSGRARPGPRGQSPASAKTGDGARGRRIAGHRAAGARRAVVTAALEQGIRCGAKEHDRPNVPSEGRHHVHTHFELWQEQ